MGYGITERLDYTGRDIEDSLIPRGLDFTVGETEARKHKGSHSAW